MKTITKLLVLHEMRYLYLAVALALLAVVSWGYGPQTLALVGSTEGPGIPALAAFVLFAVCGFISFYGTRKTPIPPFVVLVFFGVAGHALFEPIVSNPVLLSALVTGSAVVILFGGGLEMPLRDFRRLFAKIVLLAIPGVLITAYFFSTVLVGMGGWFGFTIAPTVALLLGALLSSTDPAAIIPVLQHLRFGERQDPKTIVIAESALNDVVGTILTTTFLGMVVASASISFGSAYASLVRIETMQSLVHEVGVGVLWGFLGYLALHSLARFKRRHAKNVFGPDHFYFLAVPIAAFVGASVFGGSGFLAAFVAGLIFHGEEHMEQVEHYFYQFLDAAAKVLVFILVGALVDVQALLVYAPIGISAALVFMLVLRPVAVFLTLGGYLLSKSESRLSIKELLFISFVRETGAIPAVLLVTIVASGVSPIDGLVEIGMWVILCTLVLAPPLTPFVARTLGVAK